MEIHMGEQGADIKRAVIWALATGFGVGLSPIFPGTLGTILGIPISLAISRMDLNLQPLLVLLLLLLGIWISGMAERSMGRRDDRRIVIDEMVAYPVCMLWITHTVALSALAFLLFRFLDILKPQPIAFAQALKGGIGIVADDLIAAAITNIVLRLAMNVGGLWFG